MADDKFRLGKLTEEDFDQDYEPGRGLKTMSPEHKQGLDALIERARKAAAEIRKSTDEIVVVLKREE